MAIRISAAFARNIATSKQAGETPDHVLVTMAKHTPVEVSRVSIPGKVKPNFKAEAKLGLTNGDVFGDICTENVLDVSATKLMRGEYNGRLKMSEEISLSLGGVDSLGGLALKHMLMACENSADEVASDWSRRVQKNVIAEETESEPASEPATVEPETRKRGKKQPA